MSANMPSRTFVTNYYYEHFSSSSRSLATGVDEECLELSSWNNSKPTPCLLVRHIHQATPHHAAAAACFFKRPCASRRDAPHERASARGEYHSPAMSTAHTFHARDGARDRARCIFFVSGRCRRRGVVCSRWCVWVFYRRAKRRQAPW